MAGLPHRRWRRCDLGAAPASLWRIYSTTNRFVGSVPLGHSEEAAASRPETELSGSRSPMESCSASTRTPRQWPRRFRSAHSSTPPTPGTHSRSARERSGSRSRRSLRDDLPPMRLGLLTLRCAFADRRNVRLSTDLPNDVAVLRRQVHDLPEEKGSLTRRLRQQSCLLCRDFVARSDRVSPGRLGRRRRETSRCGCEPQMCPKCVRVF